MDKQEIADLLERIYPECGYMYTLGVLRGLYAGGAIDAIEWGILVMKLDDYNRKKIASL